MSRSGKVMTRREALALLGAAGFACLAARAAGAPWLRGLFDGEPEGVFKGGAPDNELWALWRKRGWVKEASHYEKIGGNVQCRLCPNHCLLFNGDRGRCRNRVNRGGTLYTMAYANPCTFHVDPIEKKPLFHFLPGTQSFSLAASGCVFRCLNCQNWDISQKTPEETKDPRGPELRLRPPLPDSLSYDEMRRLSLFPEDAAAAAAGLGCPSISYTYSEPTAWYEYALDTCRAARQRGIRNVLVTCGSIEERPLREILQHVDAAHVDLKGFDEETYRRLNSGRLQPVLNTLKTYHDTGVWFEIINLIVPTYTDRTETIKRMCGWIVENLGPDRPLHFSRFHPEYKLGHLPPTPVEVLVQAREIARAAGLRYVYIGNVRGVPDAGTTFCPNCGKPVVERDIFTVNHLQLDGGKCRFCQTPIAGVWSG